MRSLIVAASAAVTFAVLFGCKQASTPTSVAPLYDSAPVETRNIEVTVDADAGTATSECYVTFFQQTDSFPLQPIFSGHYCFAFTQVNGSWRFTKRVIRYGLVGDLSAHLNAPAELVPNA